MKTVNKYLLLLGATWMTAASAASYAADTKETAKPPSPAQQRAMNFNKTDLNGDSFVTREEFAESNHLSSAAPTSARDIRAGRIMEAFQDMDKNADERVSGEEYISYMEKNGG
jgi:hypothetical protein